MHGLSPQHNQSPFIQSTSDSVELTIDHIQIIEARRNARIIAQILSDAFFYKTIQDDKSHSIQKLYHNAIYQTGLELLDNLEYAINQDAQKYEGMDRWEMKKKILAVIQSIPQKYRNCLERREGVWYLYQDNQIEMRKRQFDEKNLKIKIKQGTID